MSTEQTQQAAEPADAPVQKLHAHFSAHSGAYTICTDTGEYFATVQIYQFPRNAGLYDEGRREANVRSILSLSSLQAERDRLKTQLGEARKRYLRAAELAVQFYPCTLGPIPTEEPTEMDFEIANMQDDVESAKEDGK